MKEITEALRRFAVARDWDQFHTPKNLAMALAGEVGELVSELQWLSHDEADPIRFSCEFRDRLGDEVADVLIYLVRFADVCGIDLVSEVRAKLSRNEERYPVDLARGNAQKYTDLTGPKD